MSLRVAVIGAGAAGIAALRHMVTRRHTFTPIAFEQGYDVGGTWIYTEKTATDGVTVHSSMYKNLRTNLPKEVMAYPDFPFPSSLPSFITHTEVHAYLHRYAEEFALRDYILFGTKVEHIAPSKKDGTDEWILETRQDGDEESKTWKFDAVIVCTGHYSEPLMPKLPELEEFSGQVLHSHDYRHPQACSGQRVLCLGAAASGQDVALDIATHATMVYLGHEKPRLASPLPSNVIQTRGVDHMTQTGVVTRDGQKLELDTLILCTGYQYTYPFLSPQCQLRVVDQRVTPLYKHIIHTGFPTLCIIGIPKVVVPFPQFDCQVQFFLASLDGSMTLPSKDEMDADTEADFSRRLSQGMPPRHAHHMGLSQWPYNDELTRLAGVRPIPAVVRALYDHVHATRTANLPHYKCVSYQLLSETEFRELPTD